MTVTLLLRRFGLLILGAALLAWGLGVFLTQSTVSVSWIAYDLSSGTAMLPGAPSVQFGNGDAFQPHQFRQLSLSGQLSIAVGAALLAGWIGFALGKRRGAVVAAQRGGIPGGMDLAMPIPDAYREDAR